MIKTQEFLVNMGPQHPSTHGVLRLILRVDGEVIVDVEPVVGYLHRGIEKIAENCTYTQFIPFTDRLDYIASMNNNLAYVLAVEKLLNIEIPKRAQYIRVIVAELNRIASHLVFFGTYALDLGAITPFLYAFREREKILDIFEKLCGARLTYNYLRIGGVARDVPDNFKEDVQNFIKYFAPYIDEYNRLLTYNKIFLKRTKGIGVINREVAINYGLTGPNLRASGVMWDLRKNSSYSSYSDFEFEIPIGEVGDTFDRYFLRICEMRESLKIVKQAVDNLPDGEIVTKVPRIIRPPQGESYQRCENPRGELAFYIVSDGSDKPYRLKIRAPSFINLQILPEIMKGHKIADIVAILGSIDIVLGEVDR